MNNDLKKEAGTVNRREERQMEREKGSGQQTAGKRGESPRKSEEQHYRSTEQKRQRGNHGGNR